MTHDKNHQSGKSPAPQYGIGFNKKQSVFFRGSDSFGKEIRYFQETSLPVCSGSTADWKTGSGSRQEDGFYGQDFSGSDPSSSSICQFNGQDAERNCQPGTGSFPAKRSGAWIIGKNVSEILRWNIALTDCHLKR